MKITRRELRRLIAEATFTSSQPLNRGDIQFELGTHPEQLQGIELRNHPRYKIGKEELYNFIESEADGHWGLGFAGGPETVDTIVANGVNAVKEAFAERGIQVDITEAHIELMLQDLIGEGYVTINDDEYFPTDEGRAQLSHSFIAQRRY